jgi:hypothetical protein
MVMNWAAGRVSPTLMVIRGSGRLLWVRRPAAGVLNKGAARVKRKRATVTSAMTA